MRARRWTDPTLYLLAQMIEQLPIPVIAEGRVQTPEQARRALELGAWAVVVGSAITRPRTITARFVNAHQPKSVGAMLCIARD